MFLSFISRIKFINPEVSRKMINAWTILILCFLIYKLYNSIPVIKAIWKNEKEKQLLKTDKQEKN